MLGKKKRFGFGTKKKDMGTLSQEYSRECMLYGHKTREITQFEAGIARLQGECAEHLKTMLVLNKEANEAQERAAQAHTPNTQAQEPTPKPVEGKSGVA